MKSKIKFLIPLSVLLFIFTTCQETYFYLIKNDTNKDIKVIFIENNPGKNDTIGKFIIGPGVLYEIYKTTESMIWFNPGDTLHFGYQLIITQDQKPYNKSIAKSWEYSGDKKYILYVREMDFE